MTDDNVMIIYTPTIEEYIKVVKKLLDQGIMWYGGDTDIDVKCWEIYRSETHIVVSNKNYFTYCDTEYACAYKSHVIDSIQFLFDDRNYLIEKYGLK